MERTFVRGKTDEERFASIDQTLKHFQRRLGTKIVGVIPPVPILHRQILPTQSGEIFGAILPLSGTVVKLCLYVGKYHTTKVSIAITIEDTQHSSSHTIDINRRIETYNIDYPVEAGNVVRILVTPPASIEDTMVGILIHPYINESRRDKQLLEGILALEESQGA